MRQRIFLFFCHAGVKYSVSVYFIYRTVSESMWMLQRRIILQDVIAKMLVFHSIALLGYNTADIH